MTVQLQTIDEVAKRLRLKAPTVRRWVFLRKLDYVKVGGLVRIPESEIERVIQEGTVHRLTRELSFEQQVSA
jgi:excisionase family DNA binding protein